MSIFTPLVLLKSILYLSILFTNQYAIDSYMYGNKNSHDIRSTTEHSTMKNYSTIQLIPLYMQINCCVFRVRYRHAGHVCVRSCLLCPHELDRLCVSQPDRQERRASWSEVGAQQLLAVGCGRTVVWFCGRFCYRDGHETTTGMSVNERADTELWFECAKCLCVGFCEWLQNY